ncbi:unnamed protein product [Paramecium octaurelia]|uniref:Uncharacterized protein n=1 Tax=Paramecium octaurelia TaxID=43137 RepID=A0A8S1TBN4_PAROT|nr:unnamed protein product [Paramecium octaurelia]
MQSSQRILYQPIGAFCSTLLCKICKNLTIDPVECTQCENLYCKECYQISKSSYDKCPDQNCAGPFTTKQPHRIVRDQLSKISFRCVNHNEGCKIVMAQESVIKHMAECPYQQISCKCGQNLLRTNLESHKNICHYYKTQNCPLCQQNVTLQELKSHKCLQELTRMIQQLQEKFQDYKEESNYAIIEIKNQQNERNNQLTQAKQQLQYLQDENSQLKIELQTKLLKFKENIEQLDQQRKHQMENKEQQQQAQMIQNGELIDSNQQFCSKNHKLSFWKKPSGEEKKKNCSKCLKSNTTCRYFCQQCTTFTCFKCLFPELKIEKQSMKPQCSSKHQMNQISDDFRCSACDKKGEDMIQPIAFYCAQCELRICFQCIKNKKFKEID